jgi:uncharacterized protein
MRLGFGDDFTAARHDWRYQRDGSQVWWMAILLAFAGFAILSILQVVTGSIALGIHLAVDPSMLDQLKTIDPKDKDALIRFSSKDIIVGIGPAAIAGALAAWGLAGIGVQNRWAALGLRRINLGMLGWFVVVVGFIVAMFVMNIVFSKLMHFDEKQVGVVEQAMADMRAQPLLYAMSLPGIMIFTPIVEELIFRGALFHSLLTTRLGMSGTVVVTSALWAIIHATTAPWVAVGVIFMMGLVLGILLLRFGSLWVTIVCHATWNLMTSLVIFNLPGAQ